MKIKIVLAGMIMMALALGSYAQGGGGQRRTAEERTKRAVDTMTSVFKLDEAQQAQVQTAFMDYNKAMDKVRESMQGGTRPDRTAFEKLTTERDEKLKSLYQRINSRNLKKKSSQPCVLAGRQAMEIVN